MITLKDIYKIQAEYGVADSSFKDSEISFEEYLAQCRVFISKNLPEEYTKGNWDTSLRIEDKFNEIYNGKYDDNVNAYIIDEVPFGVIFDSCKCSKIYRVTWCA